MAEILKFKGLKLHCKNYFNHFKHVIIMILQFRLRHYPYLLIPTRSSSLRSRRLEVVGERENGRARGRHANQAPATQAKEVVENSTLLFEKSRRLGAWWCGYTGHIRGIRYFCLIIFVICCSTHKKCTSQKSQSSICLSVIPQVL